MEVKILQLRLQIYKHSVYFHVSYAVEEFGNSPPFSLFHLLQCTTNLLVPLVAKWPHSMMIPPPCLRVNIMLLGLKALHLLLQTYLLSLWPNSSFVSFNLKVLILEEGDSFLGAASQSMMI